LSKSYRYTVVSEPAEDGGYVATFPALPGLVTEGESLDEAAATGGTAHALRT